MTNLDMHRILQQIRIPLQLLCHIVWRVCECQTQTSSWANKSLGNQKRTFVSCSGWMIYSLCTFLKTISLYTNGTTLQLKKAATSLHHSPNNRLLLVENGTKHWSQHPFINLYYSINTRHHWVLSLLSQVQKGLHCCPCLCYFYFKSGGFFVTSQHWVNSTGFFQTFLWLYIYPFGYLTQQNVCPKNIYTHFICLSKTGHFFGQNQETLKNWVPPFFTEIQFHFSKLSFKKQNKANEIVF